MSEAFDNLWAEASATMDDAVDGVLSDTLSVSIAGGPFRDMSGWVLDEVEGEGLPGFDEELGVRQRVKVRATLLPLPLQQHRIRHPRLGAGTFRPAGSHPQTQGRYWIFDVQKVTA